MSAGADDPAEIITRWSMGQPVFWTDPSSASDTGGGRSILRYTSAWTAANDQDSKEYGNVDWVNTDGTLRLSWWGPSTRYWSRSLIQLDGGGPSDFFINAVKHGAIWQHLISSPSGYRFYRVTGSDYTDSTPLFSDGIFYRGIRVATAPLRVFGAGIATDPDDSANKWLIAICGYDSADSNHSSPGTKVYAAQWNNGNPGDWTAALAEQDYNGTGSNGVPATDAEISRIFTQNLDPWVGRGDGLLYKSRRYDIGTFSEGEFFDSGVHQMSVTISFSGGTPTAAISFDGLIPFYGGAVDPGPSILAIDYEGDTELTLHNDGGSYYWSDGANDYDVMESSGFPIYGIAAFDLRARAFLLTRTLYSEGGDFVEGEEAFVRLYIDESTTIEKIIYSESVEFEVAGTFAFSARKLYTGEDNEGVAYIACAAIAKYVEDPPETFTVVPLGPYKDLRFIRYSDSAETAGDLDTITANGGANPRYMPTGVY